jgi:cell fate regulator YaaT (PSP1 superfamily)
MPRRERAARGRKQVRNIVAVRFKTDGKSYHFHTADPAVQKNEPVIVDTENGPVLGTVIRIVRAVPDEDLPLNLKEVIRSANAEDFQIRDENAQQQDRAFEFCQERIRERGLPMKLIEVECLFDRSKLIFYFTAENRVDFRELVKDLVQKFKTRIELRQIGARQEARIVKGLGICGREVCCVNMLQNLDRVSVKMAKEQSMSLNPEKISGLCGRLMCCLAYEYEGYLEMKKDMPKCGKIIQTREGPGKVLRQNILHGEISVLLEGGKEICLPVKDLQP